MRFRYGSAGSLKLVSELELALLPVRHVFFVVGASVGEPIGTDGYVHFFFLGPFDDLLWLTIQVQHQGGVRVPGRYNRSAPPVTTLIVVDVPRNNRVVWVPGPVVLGVNLDAVTVWIPQVEIERVRHTVTAWAAFDRVRTTQGTQLVTDGQNVVLLVGGKRDVVHPWAIATGHRGVMDGWFPTHPRGIYRAVAV